MNRKLKKKTLPALAYGWQVKKFSSPRFILNIAHTHKRPMNKLMAAFKGVFLTLFHKNTGLKSLFNIKLCIRFDIESI